MKKSKVYDCSDEEFCQLIQNSNSMSECCRKIGLSEKGSNARKQIRKRCEELQIDCSHLSNSHPLTRHNPQKQELDSILIENSTYLNRTALKQRLIKEGKLEYKCAICGNNGIWNNTTLTLQLDHINGINNDNRIENLRFLCPNCHSQTITYSGHNKITSS